jgi:hypothetical protein
MICRFQSKTITAPKAAAMAMLNFCHSRGSSFSFSLMD